MPVRTPHDWYDIAGFITSRPEPCVFMLGLVGHVRRGYDGRLVPLFFHGTVNVFDKAGDGRRHVTVYPPAAGVVRIELLEGEGAETRAVESQDVSEQDGIAAFDSILPRVLADPR